MAFVLPQASLCVSSRFSDGLKDSAVISTASMEVDRSCRHYAQATVTTSSASVTIRTRGRMRGIVGSDLASQAHYATTLSHNVASNVAPRRQRAKKAFSASYNEHDATVDDQEYIEAHVMDAVRMVPVRDHLYMAMSNGSEVEVEHVNPSAGRLLYPTATPTIFLKMSDSSDLLLPIVVGELAMALLMKAMRREHSARPSFYDLMSDMVHKLHHEVRMVKITQRVMDTYYARIYVAAPESNQVHSVDARPSDAINLAVRAQVPIFVSKGIVYSDAVRVVTRVPGLLNTVGNAGSQQIVQLMGSSSMAAVGTTDDINEEMALIKGMRAAAAEERYADAARLRDQLNLLRSRNRRQLHNKF